MIDFSKVLGVVNTAASLYPAASALVQGVEAAMPPGTPGLQKLEAVQTGLSVAYNVAGGITADFEVAWPFVNDFIGKLVGVFNSRGTFTKAT